MSGAKIRKDGDTGVAAGARANERSEALIQSMDIDVCEEDCEPESELDSDEFSEDEDDYEQ